MEDRPYKYDINIKCDTIDEVIEEALHLVYIYLLRALIEHRRQGRNGEYERFAIELLAMLQKHRVLYTTDPTDDIDE